MLKNLIHIFLILLNIMKNLMPYLRSYLFWCYRRRPLREQAATEPKPSTYQFFVNHRGSDTKRTLDKPIYSWLTGFVDKLSIHLRSLFVTFWPLLKDVAFKFSCLKGHTKLIGNWGQGCTNMIFSIPRVLYWHAFLYAHKASLPMIYFQRSSAKIKLRSKQ